MFGKTKVYLSQETMNQSHHRPKETQLEKPLEGLLNMYIENMNIYERLLTK